MSSKLSSLSLLSRFTVTISRSRISMRQRCRSDSFRAALPLGTSSKLSRIWIPNRNLAFLRDSSSTSSSSGSTASSSSITCDEPTDTLCAKFFNFDIMPKDTLGGWPSETTVLADVGRCAAAAAAASFSRLALASFSFFFFFFSASAAAFFFAAAAVAALLTGGGPAPAFHATTPGMGDFGPVGFVPLPVAVSPPTWTFRFCFSSRSLMMVSISSSVFMFSIVFVMLGTESILSRKTE
mmetsp:Transcript_2755/g.6404  ORF Transcript_2755/g.6404 Transcript_2755/m.6404 type:complete len:238 (-) Transcript_2755:1610-2323(-)